MPQTTLINLQPNLLLTERDRIAFFQALIRPPKPNDRLERAFRAARERVTA
jgi:uncharacterized protein (DUF1778 family)